MEHGHDKHSAVEASSIPEESSSLGIGGGGKIIWKLEKGLKWMGMRKSRKRNESEPLVGPGFALACTTRARAPNTTPANAAQLAGGESEKNLPNSPPTVPRQQPSAHLFHFDEKLRYDNRMKMQLLPSMIGCFRTTK
ncbi:hypothetical protein T08_10913 [Trichinella sp. T8]|nr:hypothetical protein T08_10913 [Trichinella sp. T8]